MWIDNWPWDNPPETVPWRDDAVTSPDDVDRDWQGGSQQGTRPETYGGMTDDGEMSQSWWGPERRYGSWNEKIKIKETDAKSDKDFAEKWNRVCGNPISYNNKDGVNMHVHTWWDELWRFIQIQKSFIENGRSQLTNYRLYKSGKWYMLTIEDNEWNISRMENLSEDELQWALENIQKRIDEGEEVKKQERDKQRQLFDSYANNESKKADSNLENALNNLA